MELSDEIKKIVNDLVDNYQKFIQSKAQLLSEMEDAKKTIDLCSGEDTKEFTPLKKPKTDRPQTPQHSPHLEALKKKNSWYGELTKIVSSTAGLEIGEFSTDTFRITFLPSQHQLTLQFVPDLQMKVLDGVVELIPNDIPYSDIVDYAKTTNDISLLIRELQTRIRHIAMIKQEVETLQKRYNIKYDSKTSVVRVTLSSGIIGNLELEGDYPQPHARVFVRSLEGISGAGESFRAEVNRGSILSLSQVLQKLESFR